MDRDCSSLVYFGCDTEFSNKLLLCNQEFQIYDSCDDLIVLLDKTISTISVLILDIDSVFDWRDILKCVVSNSNPKYIFLASSACDAIELIDTDDLVLCHFLLKTLSWSILKNMIDSAFEVINLKQNSIHQQQKTKEANDKISEQFDLIDRYLIASSTDTKGNITYISQAFCDVIGYSKDEFLGRGFKKIRDPHVDSFFYKELWATIKSGKEWCGELSNISKDGKRVWRISHIKPVKDSQTGAIIGYFQVAENITYQLLSENLAKENETLQELVDIETQKRMEKEKLLLRQSRMAAMGELISNIAHQWRQPLNALAIKIQDIPAAIEFGEFDHKYATEFKEKSMDLIQYMSHTIEDFRAFFKPNSEKSIFSIVDCIEKSCSLVRDTMSIYEIIIDIRVNSNNLFVYGYPNEFSQVILNLLSNSKDALVDLNEPKKNIWIEISKIEDSALLTIEDSGGGISVGYLDRVFEPYFTTKEQGKGSGLGLYMSKEIVQRQMGGEIVCENSQNGAKFIISIPIIYKAD